MATILALAALSVIGVVAGGLGWMAHEQSMRQQILTQEVEQALQEASDLGDRVQTLTGNPYQWEATLAAAFSALKRAEGLAAQDKTGLSQPVRERLATLRARLDADEKDRRFIERFEEIRLEQSEIHTDVGLFKYEVAYPTLNEAFRTHYGIEFAVTPLEEFVTFVQGRPAPVRDTVIGTLDVCLTYVPKHEESTRLWLSAVLQSVETNPWRKCARAAADAGDWQLLRELFEEGLAAHQPAVVLEPFAAKVPRENPIRLDLLRRMQDVYVGDYWANTSLALALHDRKRPQFEEAIRYYMAAIAVRPRNPATYVNLANAFLGIGDSKKALAAHHRALEIAPDYAMAHRSLGHQLRAMGDLAGAKAAYQKFIAFTVDPAAASFRRAMVHQMINNDLEAAIAAYRESIRLKSTASDAARFNIGYALTTLGRPEEAIAEYREALRITPKYVKARVNLGDLLQERGRLDEAIELYREGIRLSPRSRDLHYELGWAYKAKDRGEDAVAEFREAIRLDPLDNPCQYALANALLSRNLLDESILVFREAIRLKADDADSHFWLAVALKHKGRWDEAAVEYREALRLKPDIPEARKEVARHSNERAWEMATHADVTKRDYVRALALAKEAVEFEPGDGRYWNSLGAACYRTGHWKDAVTALQKSLDITGGDSFDYFFLAMTLWEQGDEEKARQWHKRAVEWMDKNKPLDKELLRFARSPKHFFGQENSSVLQACKDIHKSLAQRTRIP